MIAFLNFGSTVMSIVSAVLYAFMLIEGGGNPMLVQIGDERYYLGDLPDCVEEDSTDVDCHWNAAERGNGQGESFVVVDGVTYMLGW